MYFSKLYDCENKQRLNLSIFTYTTLVRDMEVFCPNDSVSPNGNIPSIVINHIFECYHDSACASISQKLHIRKKQLLELIGNASSEQHIIKLLLEEEKKKLIKEVLERCKKKGCPVSFRLSNANLEFLLNEGQAEASYYQDDVGLYIKAVLEEYASLPYADREKIYNKEICQKMRHAIETQSQIKLTLKSALPVKQSNQKVRIYVKPYKLCQDSDNLYNYLVGYIQNSENGPWTIGAVRISSVADCSVMKLNAFVSTADKKAIERHLQAHGVEYISSNEDAQKILVQFTAAGEKLYHRMFHIRPSCVAKYDNRVYEFRCTQWQAINYFFKFGKDVRILEPQRLAKSFYKRYQAAANQYGEL